MLKCGISPWLPSHWKSKPVRKKRGRFHGEERQNSHQEAWRFTTAKVVVERLSFTFSLPRVHPLLVWRPLLELRGQAAAKLRLLLCHPICSSSVPPAALHLEEFSESICKATQFPVLMILVFSRSASSKSSQILQMEETHLLIFTFFLISLPVSYLSASLVKRFSSYAASSDSFNFEAPHLSHSCVRAPLETWPHQPTKQPCSRSGRRHQQLHLYTPAETAAACLQ